jgi:hypothetical protein
VIDLDDSKTEVSERCYGRQIDTGTERITRWSGEGMQEMSD